MTLSDIFSADDYPRIVRTLQALAAHDLSAWALTGGIAIELHIARRGGATMVRPLHDIDFISRSFGDIPASIGREFLSRHVHPDDPPGKTLLQCVCPETAVRVDVFRAYGAVMDRIAPIDLPCGQVGMISLEDLTAKAARLSWDLAENRTLAPKYARDFLRLLDVVATDEVEAAWTDHRKPGSPTSFAQTADELRRLIASRSHLLVAPDYSTEVDAACLRCRDTPSLRPTDARRILSLLGYC